MKYYSYQELVEAIDVMGGIIGRTVGGRIGEPIDDIIQAIDSEGVTPWRPISEIKDIPLGTIVLLRYCEAWGHQIHTVSEGSWGSLPNVGTFDAFMVVPA